MHSVACLEVPKLPDDVDGWKIKLALHDITGWMHASKNNVRPLVLPWFDDFDMSGQFYPDVYDLTQFGEHWWHETSKLCNIVDF